MVSGVDYAAYYSGRTLGKLEKPFKGQDKVFASFRLDGQDILDADFTHCTFGGISFKRVTVQNAGFLNCVFIDCYFRRTELRNTRFTGCRFIDCRFPYVVVKSCDFRHSSFQGCQLAYSEMVHSLPSEPNLREEIARNLALESAALGLYSESRKYRMAEIRAREEHLLSAFLGRSQWYRDHFDFTNRVKTFIEWLLSKLNGLLWGYGEKWWVLMRNLLLVSLLLFPLLFYVFRNDIAHGSNGAVGVPQLFYFSLENIVPTGIQSEVIAVGGTARFLAGLESFLGIVAIALFASYIFRWSLRR